jgi:thioredoxin-like negative regulator of GroEL
VFGDVHPSTLNARLELAMALLSAGRRDAAAGVLKPALARLTERHGEGHPLTRFCAALLADARAR